MSFFNPWLWFGLLALGAPIWLHLQRRADRDAIAFPAMRFLDDAPIAKRAPLSLRDVLLFLLRIAVVALLTFVFAWPYIRTDKPQAVSASIVYILDDTLSQQSGDRFTKDRDEIVDEFEKLGDATQAAVIVLTSKPQTVVNFSDNRADAAAKLKALKPSMERGSYISAFRLANTLLERSLGGKREIILYGDQQLNQWTESANAPPFLRGLNVRVARPAKAIVQDNVAVSSPEVVRVFLGDRSVVRCKTMLQHTGNPGSATVVLEANHKEIFRRPINVTEQPPNATLLTEWECEASEWIEGSIRVEHAKDNLAQDDVAWFAAPPIVEGRVALLSRSAFLRTALSPEVAKGRWKAIEINPAKLDELAKAEGADDADVFVLEASFLQSDSVRAAVDRYLAAGRGVFICVDRVTPIVHEALRGLGFGVTEGVTEETQSVRVGKFLLTHPVFGAFASPDLGNIFAIGFERLPKVEALRGTPVLFSDHGDPLIFESNQGAGRIFLSAFTFERTMTDWVIDPTFIPFLDLSLQHLRRQSQLVSWLEPGDSWSTDFVSGEKAAKVSLRKGDNTAIESASLQGRTAKFRPPAEAGIYKLTFDDDPKVRRIAIMNPRPEESELKYQTGDAPALAAWKFADAGKPVDALTPVPTEMSVRREEYRQKYWWYLALAAFAFLVTESLFLFGRKRTEATTV